jgi:hypothetical protein
VDRAVADGRCEAIVLSRFGILFELPFALAFPLLFEPLVAIVYLL